MRSQQKRGDVGQSTTPFQNSEGLWKKLEERLTKKKRSSFEGVKVENIIGGKKIGGERSNREKKRNFRAKKNRKKRVKGPGKGRPKPGHIECVEAGQPPHRTPGANRKKLKKKRGKKKKEQFSGGIEV